MDLFEQMQQRESEKCKQQEIKVQQLRQKLNNADDKFFKEDTLDCPTETVYFIVFRFFAHNVWTAHKCLTALLARRAFLG